MLVLLCLYIKKSICLSSSDTSYGGHASTHFHLILKRSPSICDKLYLKLLSYDDEYLQSIVQTVKSSYSIITKEEGNSLSSGSNSKYRIKLLSSATSMETERVSNEIGLERNDKPKTTTQTPQLELNSQFLNQLQIVRHLCNQPSVLIINN